jgi:hypothetical protein
MLCCLLKGLEPWLCCLDCQPYVTVTVFYKAIENTQPTIALTPVKKSGSIVQASLNGWVLRPHRVSLVVDPGTYPAH